MRVVRPALATSLLVLGVLACDDEAAERAKQCGYAIEDAQRALDADDVAKARTENEKATKLCPPEKQAAVKEIAAKIDARSEHLTKLREQQDKVEKKTEKKKGPMPIAGKHSSEAKATLFCKDYVDCVCGIADWVYHVSGEDSQRTLCTDAKKVLGGAKPQEDCEKLLGEFTSNPNWRQPWEAMQITIPAACP